VGWISTWAGPIIVINATPHTSGIHEMVVICCFNWLVNNVLTQLALESVRETDAGCENLEMSNLELTM